VVFDLDDTLYPELSFLQSAYRAIAAELTSRYGLPDLYPQMLAWWQQGENVFERLIATHHLPLTVSDLLSQYRHHEPHISLSAEVQETLTELAETAVLGLITDGRSVTQHNKIKALGLSAWMAPADMLISEETGYEKPSEAPYRHFMTRYPSCTYYYIADNPQKDFVAPNRLGWTTICLLDDGHHIHPQNLHLPPAMLPQHTVSQLADIRSVILSQRKSSHSNHIL